MQEKRNLKPKLLVLALAGAIGSMPLGAFAIPSVTLTALESLGSDDPNNAVNVMDGNANGGDYFRYATVGANSSFFHTYGFSTGVTYFGARASGDGTFFVKTSASYSDTYRNDTGVAQLLTFSFNVDQGQIGISGSGTGYADLQLRLSFNNVLVAGDHARVNGTACNFDQGGSAENTGVLDGYLTCQDSSNASGSGQAYSVSQLVGVGAEVLINYEIISEAAGSFTAGSGANVCSYGPEIVNNLERGGDGAQQDVIGNFEGVEPVQYCGYFNAIARSGDPAGINLLNNGLFSISSTPQGVPEPGTLALAGLALGGLAQARRKRKERQAV